jgi:orotidine-5'-phosphate decarboxylase
MSNPVYVAIDTPNLDNALALTKAVKLHVGGVKLGLEFFCANGQHGVHEIAKLGLPIFLDLKLHDIPNTVAKAAAGTHTKVVAVTVLTSLDDHDLNRVGVSDDPHAQVERLAALAREAGLDGIVCSGQEVKAAHKIWRDGFFVVPGLRPAGGKTGDQKRTVTPRQARDDGASILVIGRPITGADVPDDAARAIVGTL